ncbi:MMPL family transporter [Salipaludibacillus daqingensis]|uniref:MMPL family transporter n=1 Tax=Salipaludibacillus daqingensis TaxID=3041001 RepID=UPI00247407AC|nr:MMPL family transporter [Salipaludibacillus daqingensis]
MKSTYRWIYALPIVWIVVGAWLFFASPDMDQLVREKGQFSIPDHYTTSVTDEILKQNEGASGQSILIVYYEESGLQTSQIDDVHAKLTSLGSEIDGYPIEEITSPLDSEEQEEFLISEDGTTMMGIVTMDINLNDIPLVRDNIEKAITVTGVDHFMSGSSIIEDDVIISSEEGLATTEIITVIFVLSILFIVFRSLAAPFIPLITVGATYLVTISVVAFLIDSFQFPVSNFTQIFIVAILFGIGTDYCILLLTRFKEELIRGADRVTAMKQTYRAVGATVFSSALTGFIGFAAIGLADFDLYQSAVGVAVGIIILIAALWIWIPASMLLLGDKLFWPSKGGLETTQSRLWSTLGRFSVYKPGWTLMILALLLIPAALFYDQKLSYDSLDEISDDYPSVHAIQLISEKFGEGYSFPINIVIESDETWDQSSMVPYIELISTEISKLDEVEEVRSATRPEGIVVEDFRIPFIAGELAEALKEMDEGLDDVHEALIEISDELSQDNDLSDASEGVEEVMAGTSDIQEGQQELADGVDQTGQATEDSADGINQLRIELTQLNDQLEQQIGGGSIPPELSQSLIPFTSGIEELNGGFRDIEEGLRALADNQNNIADEMRTVSSGLEEIQEGQSDIQKAFDEIQVSYSDLAEGLYELSEGIEEIQDGMSEVEELLDDISNQSPHPMEGFFVPEKAFEDGGMDELVDLFMTPNQHVALLDVVLSINPYSNEAIEVVELVEDQVSNAVKGSTLEDNIRFSLGGLSAVNRDLQMISDEDFNRTAFIMLSGIFIVLIILLKSIIMPVYIIASLLLTYIASMAFTELIFVTILGYAGISWAVPFFGFVMLMALGVDYSIFLMGRFGENIKLMPVKEALVSAMAQIGTVILSAAIILAGTFGAMMPSGVLSLVQIGTLVLTGLMLYSLVMLPLFVPVMVTIFGDKNWLPFKKPEQDKTSR